MSGLKTTVFDIYKDRVFLNKKLGYDFVDDLDAKAGGRSITPEEMIKQLNERMDKKHINTTQNGLSVGSAVIALAVSATIGSELAEHASNALTEGGVNFVKGLGLFFGSAAALGVGITSKESQQINRDTHKPTLAEKLYDMVRGPTLENRKRAVEDFFIAQAERNGQSLERGQVFGRSIEKRDWNAMAKLAVEQFENGSTYKHNLRDKQKAFEESIMTVNIDPEDAKQVAKMVKNLEKNLGPFLISNDSDRSAVEIALVTSFGDGKELTKDRLEYWRQAAYEDKVKREFPISSDSSLAHSM